VPFAVVCRLSLVSCDLSKFENWWEFLVAVVRLSTFSTPSVKKLLKRNDQETSSEIKTESKTLALFMIKY